MKKYLSESGFGSLKIATSASWLDGYENNGIPSISNSKLLDKVSDTSVDYDLMKGFLKKYSLI